MRRRPIGAVLGAGLLVAALAGCGSSQPGPDEPSASEPATTSDEATTEPSAEPTTEPTTEEADLVPVTVDSACGPELNALLLPLGDDSPGTELIDGFDLPEAMLDDLDVGCTLTSESPGLASTQTYAVVRATASADAAIDRALQVYGLVPADEEGYWHLGDGVPVGFDLPLADLVEVLGGPPPAFEDAQDWVVVGVSTEPLPEPLG